MKISDLPSSMHYAVLIFKQEYKSDGYGGQYPDDVMEYKVMDYSDIVPWIQVHGHDTKYKVVEVYPMSVITSVSLNSSKWSD